MMPTQDLAHATTLPASWYGRDPDIWERERRAIFGREWLMIGRDAELPDPGAYLTETVAGWPIFVIRDREGILRGFHNVCRHRAGPILWDGPGRCDVLRCRYHGWVYDTGGNLRRTPGFGDAADFDKEDFGLFPIRVGVWRGLVFVNFCADAEPLDRAMAALTAETAPWPIEGFRFHSRAEHEIACNWKTYVDNYAEGYHVRDVHPGLDKEIDSGRYEVILKDRHAVHRAPQRSGANYSGLWLWRYPNLALNIYATGMNIERMVPLGPNRTKLIYTFLFKDVSAESDAAIRAAIAVSTEVTREDIRICEATQRNLDSGVYESGRLSPQHENGVWYFQTLVRESLAAWNPAPEAAERGRRYETSLA
jgi:choline monooxygenase